MINRPTTPAYKVGTDPRRGMEDNNNVPGPGKYNPP
jgi:hypothetical protein